MDISWRLDANATHRIRTELGINPISWCETPSPAVEAAELLQQQQADSKHQDQDQCETPVDNNSGHDNSNNHNSNLKHNNHNRASSSTSTSVDHSDSTTTSSSKKSATVTVDGRVMRMKSCRSNKSIQAKKPEPWNMLSMELFLHILDFLEAHDLASCARVCHHWKSVTYDESLWRTLMIADRRISSEVVFHVITRNPKHLKIINCELMDFEDDEADVNLGPKTDRQVLSTTRLDLSSSRIADADVIKLLAMAPNLKIIDLGNTCITDDTLIAVSEKCTKLDSLSIRMVPGISEKGILAVAKGCKNLRVLSVAWATNARHFASHIWTHCKNLEHLDLSGCCSEMNDCGVKELTMGCPKLKILDLSDCYHLTNESIESIVDNLKQITSVSLSRCHLITVAAMWRLANAPSLKNINLLGCYPIVYPEIKNVCKHLAVNEQKLTYLPPFN